MKAIKENRNRNKLPARDCEAVPESVARGNCQTSLHERSTLFPKKNIALHVIAALILLFVLSCQQVPKQPADDAQIPLSALLKLPLEDKIAQLMMLRLSGDALPANNRAYGGIIVFGDSLAESAAAIAKAQSQAKIPLLVAADFERGLGQWMPDATVFPSGFAFAATGHPDFARQAGAVIAQEARAMGVHMSFSPVLDMNSEPQNPIVNYRSFGEDAATVANYGRAMIAGLQSGGLMACAKHFPGHGNTTKDSHFHLPRIDASRAELEALELLPFQNAMDAGVDAIMTGHLLMPAFDTELPASLSPKISTGLLRNLWKYDGLIVTDALEMRSLRAFDTDPALLALKAGADILLLPPNSEKSIAAIVAAVSRGEICEKRIDQSLARIWATKKKAGILGRNLPAQNLAEIGRLENRALAKKITRKATVLIKNDGLLPIYSEELQHALHIVLAQNEKHAREFQDMHLAIREVIPQIKTMAFDSELKPADMQHILSQAKNTQLCIISAAVPISMRSGKYQLLDSHAALLDQLHQSDVPLALLSFGSPFVQNLSAVHATIATFSLDKHSRMAALDALFARSQTSGKLPVSLPNYPIGHGLKNPPRAVWKRQTSDAVFEPAYQIIESAIANKVTPGAQVFAIRNGEVIANRGFGYFDYSQQIPVDSESIYDVASLTKVLATTPLAMKCVELQHFTLDTKVEQFFPEFSGPLKSQVTIRHLLTHSSGITPYVRYFLQNPIPTKEAILQDIIHRDLEYAPGTDKKYSDLGIILLGRIIEEQMGKAFETLVQENILKPLRMSASGFKPDKNLLPRIVPTEFDSLFRKELVRGEVHDENTAIMGGVSSHAGLFCTAKDIAKFAQTILNRGTFLNRRVFDVKILQDFEYRQYIPAKSDRAIGWDTPSRGGKSSAGDYFSRGSIGHLGFTGTSIWIDPTRDFAIVLLSNRVHPTRHKKGIYQLRRNFHKAFMEIMFSQFAEGVE